MLTYALFIPMNSVAEELYDLLSQFSTLKVPTEYCILNWHQIHVKMLWIKVFKFNTAKN
jgi:hypothetical protein